MKSTKHFAEMCSNFESKKYPSYEQFLLLTELSVNLANEASDKELGKMDAYTASDFMIQKELEPEAMLTGLMYIQRYRRRKEAGLLRKTGHYFTSADLFLVSMMLASKYLFDNGTKENVVNEEWAEDAGMETNEINNFEIELLNQMDWRLHIVESEYNNFCHQIRGKLSLEHWNTHNNVGSTYWQLVAICEAMENQFNINGANKLKELLIETIIIITKVMVACTAIYTCVLMTSIGICTITTTYSASTVQIMNNTNLMMAINQHRPSPTSVTEQNHSDRFYIPSKPIQHSYNNYPHTSTILLTKLLSNQ